MDKGKRFSKEVRERAVQPAFLARLKYRFTVLWQMLQLLAMARLESFASCLRRNTSLIFLMDNLLFAMSHLQVLSEPPEDGQGPASEPDPPGKPRLETMLAVLSKRASHELFALWSLATSIFLLGTLVRLFLDYQRNRLLGLAIYRWEKGTPHRIWSFKDKEAVPCRTQEDGSLTLIVRFMEKGRPRRATISIEKDGKVEVLSVN